VGAILEEVRMTHAAITFDTGALIALERRKDRFRALRGFFPTLRVFAI
jgi:hypothetical protein